MINRPEWLFEVCGAVFADRQKATGEAEVLLTPKTLQSLTDGDGNRSELSTGQFILVCQLASGRRLFLLHRR